MIKYENTIQFINDYKEYLNNNGISSAHVARKVGVSPQQLNNIYKKKELTVNDIMRLCNAIGYNCNVLIEKR